MEFSLLFLIIPYTIFLLIIAVFSFFNIYHIVSFGVKSKLEKISIIVYLIGVFIILSTTLILSFKINWSEIAISTM